MPNTKRKDPELVKFFALSRLERNIKSKTDSQSREILKEISILRALFPNNFDTATESEEHATHLYSDTSKLPALGRREANKNLESWGTLAIFIELDGGEPFVIPTPRVPQK